ncbi:hypothetical protein EDC01DRAFT_630614 [Geopyxis carbonaria]|nr:hypothetical protein EDC01DRAFT_630614 [Geopyxis carbonaria]
MHKDIEHLHSRIAAWTLKGLPRIILRARPTPEDTSRAHMWREGGGPKAPHKNTRMNSAGHATIKNTEGRRVGKRASKKKAVWAKAAGEIAAGGGAGGERTMLEQILSNFSL